MSEMSCTDRAHVLVVDDDAQIRQLLRTRLEMDGFQVSEAYDSASMATALATARIDLITLDIGLGRDNGLALARDIRARRNVPIVIISARGDEVDRVLGLEIGADDYVTKPFSPREVVARIRAVLRRSAAAPTATPTQDESDSLSFSGGTLSARNRTFRSASGEPLELTTAEFNLLEFLLRNPERVLTRDAIMNGLKGHDWAPYDRSVDAAIARLRKKCEPDPEKPIYIKTVRGVGYIFAAPVRRISDAHQA